MADEIAVDGGLANALEQAMGLPSKREKGPSRLGAWLGRQSLPRLLGLLVGNTRDLEQQLILQEAQWHARLEDRDRYITWLEGQVETFQKQLTAFQNSLLVSKNMLPTEPVTTAPSIQERAVNMQLPEVRMTVLAGLDELKEMYLYRPKEAEEKIKDLEVSQRPIDKEIHRQFLIWLLHDQPEELSGVVIAG